MEYQSQDLNPYSFKVQDQGKDYKLQQDVTAYKDYAANSRQVDEGISHQGRHYRSFAIIPDIVAIDILTKYGLDIHAQDFMSVPANLTKLKRIIMTDYPLLQTSNIRKA
jgi:hypothetical protein